MENTGIKTHKKNNIKNNKKSRETNIIVFK